MTIDEILKQIEESELVIEKLRGLSQDQRQFVAKTLCYHKGRIETFREVLFGGDGKKNLISSHQSLEPRLSHLIKS